MFSEFIAQKLYEVNVIGKEEVELYQYCFNAFIEIMGFIIIVILHSIYLGEAMKGLIFLGIVIPMRSHGVSINSSIPCSANCSRSGI